MIARTRTFLLAATCTLASLASGQVGWRDAEFPNPTDAGTPKLAARLYYPAFGSGQNAPLAPNSGGYPVVVFLHGFGGLGRFYPELGERLAEAGFIAVLSDTAQTEPQVQRDDGIALLPALASAADQLGPIWSGAFDVQRAAICGHSMGGGNTIRVLAADVGYRTGVCFAPWAGPEVGPEAPFSEVYAPSITTPLLIIHGEGDEQVGWTESSQPYFDGATGYSGLKVFARFGQSGTHSNVVRLSGIPTLIDRLVLQRSLDTVVGWLAATLTNEPRGLEQVLSDPLLEDPRVAQVQVTVREPQVWLDRVAVVGGSVGIRLAGQPGIAGLFVAAQPAFLPTPFGPLLLDPASTAGLNSTPIPASGPQQTLIGIPDDPALIGTSVWLQGATTTDGLGLRLSNLEELRVLP